VVFGVRLFEIPHHTLLNFTIYDIVQKQGYYYMWHAQIYGYSYGMKVQDIFKRYPYVLIIARGKTVIGWFSLCTYMPERN
jgi:hypothetical protein